DAPPREDAASPGGRSMLLEHSISAPERLCSWLSPSYRTFPALVPFHSGFAATGGGASNHLVGAQQATDRFALWSCWPVARIILGLFIIPASPRAWAACRAARRPRNGVPPPTPRWSARGNSGRRSCRWQRRRIQESLRPPNKRWSRMSDRNERSARCRFQLSASTLLPYRQR